MHICTHIYTYDIYVLCIYIYIYIYICRYITGRGEKMRSGVEFTASSEVRVFDFPVDLLLLVFTAAKPQLSQYL